MYGGGGYLMGILLKIRNYVIIENFNGFLGIENGNENYYKTSPHPKKNSFKLTVKLQSTDKEV